MTDQNTKQPRDNWALKGPLILHSAFSAILCAAPTYWLVVEYFGYQGNKAGILG